MLATGEMLGENNTFTTAEDQHAPLRSQSDVHVCLQFSKK